MFENLFAQSGLSLERLRAFWEIVTAGGITSAAHDDSNRQSQYSRQLKELEKYFGVELLKRGRGPIELTDAGRQLYEIIGRTLTALEELRRACAGQPVELAIGAGESLIQWLLLPRLSGFSAANPRVTVTFHNFKSREITEKLLTGEFDFGVVPGLEPRSGLASSPLGNLEFRLFVPQKFLPSNERLKFSSDILARLPLALLEGSASTRDALEAEARRLGIKLNVPMRFSSYPQLAQAVSSLDVAAVMPSLAEPFFEGKPIRVVPLPFLDKLTRPVSLAWNRKTAEVRPSVARYARLLPSVFRMERA